MLALTTSKVLRALTVIQHAGSAVHTRWGAAGYDLRRLKINLRKESRDYQALQLFLGLLLEVQGVLEVLHLKLKKLLKKVCVEVRDRL